MTKRKSVEIDSSIPEPKYIEVDNAEIFKPIEEILIGANQIITTVDGYEALYEILLECYEGVRDYIYMSLTDEQKKEVNNIKLPDYKPPLYTKSFGSMVFSEKLFHPDIEEKRIYESEQITMIQDSLLLLNETINNQSKDKGTKDIWIEYLHKLNEWIHHIAQKLQPPKRKRSKHGGKTRRRNLKSKRRNYSNKRK